MTMWLTYPLMVKVTPVPRKKGWFELASRPYRPGYFQISEFASDFQEGLVRDAKIVGWHDDEFLVKDDPRFNRQEAEAWEMAYELDDWSGEPSLAVAKTPDGYVLMFICNRPEGMLFEYMLDEDEGPEGPGEHFPSYRADTEERYAEYKKKKDEAEKKEMAARKAAAKTAKPKKAPAKKKAAKK